MGPRYSITPGAACYDTRLTDFDCRVLMCVGRHTDAQGWCSISQTKLAAHLGKSREAVNRAIAKLVEFSYLQKHDYRAAEHGDKRQNICVYRVLMDTAKPPETVMDESDLVIVGSQPDVMEGSQGVVTVASQHNDLSFSSSQRDSVSTEQDQRYISKKYTGVPTMGIAEEDFRDFAMSMKALDGSRLLAGGVLFSSTSPEGYPKLGELMDQYSAPVFEEAVRSVIARELLGGKMRVGGIRTWSYFEGAAKDIAKKRAMGGMPVVEECPY